MTTEQKNRIVSLRKAGYGYTAVARELGLSKSAISNFCRENGLSGKAHIIEEDNLINEPSRGNTVPAESFEKSRRRVNYKVSVFFADEPNEEAVAEALRILVNA